LSIYLLLLLLLLLLLIVILFLVLVLVNYQSIKIKEVLDIIYKRVGELVLTWLDIGAFTLISHVHSLTFPISY
jgi:hypothetical protein